ncbi:MAG: PEP/pyruvate-binding domain-containing protein, partial [Armatimonadetes bacterium]|nr:PEP/pyruvate-binding domain-containing protein [Armatimonadota bacterium]
MTEEKFRVSSGIPAFDEVVQGLRLGDNVVFQVDSLEDYRFFAGPFVANGIAQGRKVVYLRFAPHEPVVKPQVGLSLVELDPASGFDSFSRTVHDVIETHGVGTFFVFDNLSALAVEWATDESLANFFQVTCPFLFELDTVTYFALTRGRHSHAAVARIRDTTQLLVDVYHAKGRLYVHPLKVWDRYSPTMFLPHRAEGEKWTPVFESGDAAEVSLAASGGPLEAEVASLAPWESVYRRVVSLRLSGREPSPQDPEFLALKQELCRMLIGTHPEFSDLADRYMTIEDLLNVRRRMVGSGRIGGKAAGMLVARRILQTPHDDYPDFSEVLDDHDSFYIGSDVFFSFLVNNDLFRLRLQLTRSSRISREEFEEVERRFLAGQFPPAILEQFRSILDYFGQAPIIVRSSSLLEDSLGNAFAGKYRSEFCANQGTPEQRLEAFVRAVKLVYASALNPDALSYRRRRGLGESDEQMAILVQRVAGTHRGHYFFPTLAGVAFSRNLYAWSDRIDPNKGMVRLVFGLGTRAVERVGGDYPRLVALSNPTLRPEVGRRIAKYSQHQADVIDLKANSLVTLPLRDVLDVMPPQQLRYLVSTVSGDHVADPISIMVDTSQPMVLTFNNLIRQTGFAQTMDAILTRLEGAYGCPVDVEFTASVGEAGRVRINVLQCRPLFMPGAQASVEIKEDLSPQDVLFRSNRMISGGVVSGIRY